MDLDECYKKGFIKRTRIDKELVQSLIEMADIKETAVNTAQVNEINISAYVAMAYDALREIMEAVCISKGYKVLSHLCMGELLKDKIGGFNYNDFDRLRYTRNSINYYGKKIDFSQGKDIIAKIFSMKKIIKTALKNF